MDEKMTVYRTKDLYEASYLYTSGQKLLRLEKDKRPYWFIFESEEACHALIDKYWRKEARIDAKEFVDSLRSLKDRIFGNGDENGHAHARSHNFN